MARTRCNHQVRSVLVLFSTRGCKSGVNLEVKIGSCLQLRVGPAAPSCVVPTYENSWAASCRAQVNQDSIQHGPTHRIFRVALGHAPVDLGCAAHGLAQYKNYNFQHYDTF